MSDPVHKNEKLPLLGAMLGWVDKPGSLSVIIKILIAVCAALFVADFTYVKHGHFEAENWFGFYGIFGFFAFGAIVLLAKTLRQIIKRPEDFYAPNSIDNEATPKHMLEEKSYDGK